VCLPSGATVTNIPTVSRYNGFKTRKERKIPFVVLWFIQLDSIASDYPMFVCFWRDSPTPLPHWARVSSYTRFLDHTQRRTTVGRTPLDE